MLLNAGFITYFQGLFSGSELFQLMENNAVRLVYLNLFTIHDKQSVL